MSGTLLVRGARQLITLRGPAEPRRGAALKELSIIRDGALLIVARHQNRDFKPDSGDPIGQAFVA